MDLNVIEQSPAASNGAPPLLFVHGFWQGAWCWAEKFMPYFAERGYLCYAVDLRGHGRSPGKEKIRWYPLQAYVEDLTQVVAGLDEKPILIGHSMGGMIVQKYLETHVVPAIVLLASAPPGGLIPATWRVIGRHPWPVLKANLTLDMYHVVATPQRYRDTFFSASLPEPELLLYHNQIQTDSYRAYMDMMFLNLPKSAGSNRVPTLVIGSPTDRIVSENDVRKTAAVYNAHLELFPGMGHNMMLDEGWEQVAAAILAWLQEQVVGESDMEGQHAHN